MFQGYLKMSTGAITEITCFFAMGVRDVFCGLYRYSCSKKPKQGSSERSELKVRGLSEVASTFLWLFILNVVLFGCSEYLLNLLFLGVVQLGLHVTNIIFPDSSKYVWDTYCPSFKSLFPFLWIFPLFVISRITNLWWCQDIADFTYTARGKPASNLGITANLSDFLYTTVLEFLFFIQCLGSMLIPGVGYLLYIVSMCLLYSMYAFEYKWHNFGWQLPNRIAYIEINWPYFLGFGLPLSVLTSLTNDPILSLGLCAFLFPLCIISANYSTPPKATYKYRIPVFNFAGFLTGKIFEKLIKWQERTRTRT